MLPETTYYYTLDLMGLSRTPHTFGPVSTTLTAANYYIYLPMILH